MAYVDEALISCVSLLVALILKLDWHVMSSLSRTGKCSDATCDSVVFSLVPTEILFAYNACYTVILMAGLRSRPPPSSFLLQIWSKPNPNSGCQIEAQITGIVRSWPRQWKWGEAWSLLLPCFPPWPFWFPKFWAGQGYLSLIILKSL